MYFFGKTLGGSQNSYSLLHDCRHEPSYHRISSGSKALSPFTKKCGTMKMRNYIEGVHKKLDMAEVVLREPPPFSK